MIICGTLNPQLEIPPTISISLTKPLPQNFSLPSGIIYYIKQTPIATDSSYQKILQTCKFFITGNHVLTVGNFYIKEESNDIMLDYLTRINALSENLIFKLWLKRSLDIIVNIDIMTKFLKNIYRCNLMDITISHQSFSFNDYLMLIDGGAIKELSLYNNVIKYDNGKMVPFEDLMQQVPNVIMFKCSYTQTPQSAFNSKTAEKLTALPKFEHLKYLKIYDIYPKFNAIHFCDFIKKNGCNYGITFRSAAIDESWFKMFETELKESDFIVTMKEYNDILPFSKSNNTQNLTSIEVRKKII
jgi:hypothetical protein